MRLGEIISSRVVASDGTVLGKVADVRLVQDGPLLQSFDAAFRLDALVVGRRAIGIRLGYGRREMRGPWLLQVLLSKMARGAHVVSVDDVESIEIGTITLNVDSATVRSRHARLDV